MSAISYRPFAKVFSRVVAASDSNNKKYADYLCDGTADDVQIQAAIDAVEAAGGGTVFLREGTFTIAAGLTIDTDYVNLVGEGMGATTIKLRNSHNAAVQMVNLAANYCTIRDLTVDGNKANQASGAGKGICLDNANAGKTNCQIVRCETKNVNYASGGGNGIAVVGCDYFLVDACQIHDNEDSGIYVGSTALYGIISNCHSFLNSLEGFDIQTATIAVNACIARSNVNVGFRATGSSPIFTNCQSIANTGNGFGLSNGDHAQIVGCRSVANGDGAVEEITLNSTTTGALITGCYIEPTDDGIILSGADNNIVANNVISGASLSGDNTKIGILMTGTSLRNVINGNRIYLPSGSNNFQYGIREAAVADDFNLVVNNIVNDGQTATISLQGGSSVNANNITA
jgi:hypothetical protein